MREHKTDTFGSFFKKLRKESEFSIEKLSEKTKIQKRHLEYLEGERFEKLPPDVYVRGFIVKCCGFFKAKDQQHALLKLYARKGSRTVDGVFCNPTIAEGKPFSITPRHLAMASIGIFISLLFVYFLIRFIPFFFAPAIYLDNPSKENLVVNFSNITVQGTTKRAFSLTLDGKELYIRKNGAFEGNLELVEGVNILKFEAKNRFGRKAEAVRRVVYIKN